MEISNFLQITFQPWLALGIGYRKFAGQKELNFYLPFCMISFAWDE